MRAFTVQKVNDRWTIKPLSVEVAEWLNWRVASPDWNLDGSITVRRRELAGLLLGMAEEGYELLDYAALAALSRPAPAHVVCYYRGV